MRGMMAIVLLMAAAAAHAAETRPVASDLGNVRGGDFSAAQGVIEQKCTRCHTRDRIDVALSGQKDMAKIQKEMEKRGAGLNRRDREVLGIYWKQSPLRQKQ